MTEPHYCVECKAQLPQDIPEGLCPNCLLKLALGSASDSIASFSIPKTSSVAGARVHYFGDYELIEEIARGGMGVVYKARQISLNRIVAVKMMRPGLLASEADIQRFRVEAEAAASLQHPGIVAIHEVGEHDGLCYFSMDYVEGESLSEMVRNQPLSINRAAEYVKSIAEAVHFAHERKVLHRDLKPANVIIDSADQPRITDFGLARRIESDSRLTATGAVLGTPSYMPPEQAAGKRNSLGPASDVYSLGAMLYELLTGRPPFQAETPTDTILLALRSEPVAPRLLNPKLNRDIETICLKCLEKETRRRYQSARALADDLDRFLNRRPINARRVDPLSRGWRWCRRNPWPATAAAVLALLAVVALSSAMTLRERLWRSMLEQARSERLAGNRARSMELLAEASQMQRTDELRQEAIQTIMTPGVGLHLQIPFPGPRRVVVSEDSKLLAVAGQKLESYQRRTSFSNESGANSVPKIEVWDLESRQIRCTVDHKVEDFEGRLAFSPTESLMAASHEEYKTQIRAQADGGSVTNYLGIESQSTILWNADTGEKIATIKCQGELCDKADGPLIFSPDGARIVTGGDSCAAWLIDVAARAGHTICSEGEPVTFLSNEEVLLNCNGRLRKWSISTGNRDFLTPEGTSFVSVSSNASVALCRSKESLILFDINSRRQTTVAAGVSEDQSEALLSGDGRNVATLNKAEPNIIHLYELTAAGIKHRTIALNSNMKVFLGRQATFSPDGSFLAAFGGEGKFGGVWVWDVETGAEVAVLRGNHSPVWSPDSRLLVTRGPGTVKIGSNSTSSSSWNYDGFDAGDSNVNVWDVFPATPVYLLPASISSVAFTPDDGRLLSNGVAWAVANVRDRRELRLIPKELPAESSLLTSGDQLWAAHAPQKDFLLRLWRLAPDRGEIALEPPDYSGLRTELKGELFGRPIKFSVSPDGRFLVMASLLNAKNSGGGSHSNGDTALELWDLALRRRVAIWNESDLTSSFLDIKFSRDGRLVATGSNNGGDGITIRDASDGKELRRIKNPQLSYVLMFTPDDKLLFSAGSSLQEGDESPVFVYNVDTGRTIGVWKGHHEAVRSLAISPDGKMLASGGDDRVISIWEIPSGLRLAAWEAHKTDVTALSFSVDGRTLVSGSADGALKLWDLPRIHRELSALGLEW